MKTMKKNKLLFLAATLAAVTAGIAITHTAVTSAAAAEDRTFEMVYGASIRVDDPMGMRFKTKIDSQYYQELTKENSTTELHVAIVPYSYYTAYENASQETKGSLYQYLSSTYGADKILDLEIPTEKIYAATEGGQTYYYANAVIANVYFNNYHADFVGAAYFQRGAEGSYTYQDVTGITEEENARSIFSVADKAYADPEYKANYGNFLDGLLEKGMYNAYGVRYDTETQKYTYNETAYDTYEEMKTGIGIAISDSKLTLNEDSTLLFVNEEKQFTPVLTFSDGTIYSKFVEYTWSSSEESVATVNENGLVKALKAGTTNITVSAIGGKFTATCELTVANENIFATNAGWKAVAFGDGAVYNDTDDAIQLIKQHDGGISQNHSWFYTAIDPLKHAAENGENYASFYVKVDDVFLGKTPWLGVYANMGGNEFILSGTATAGKTTIADAYALYKECLFISNDWIKVVLNLRDIAKIESDSGLTVNSLTIACGGAQSGTILLKNFEYLTDAEYNTYLSSSEYYSALNLISQKNHTTFASTAMTKEFDATTQSVKVTKTNAGISGNHSHIQGAVADTIRAAVAAGMTHLTFSYYADAAFVGSTQPQINVYLNAGTKATMSNGYYITPEIKVTTANEWIPVEIDLTTDTVKGLLENTANTHLMFAIGGNVAATLSIRNLSFIKK